MTGPDETGINFWGIATSAIGGLLMLVWNMLNGKIAANHQAVNERIDGLDRADEKIKVNIEKIFDKLEHNADESARRAEAQMLLQSSQHSELLKAIHVGLATKADK
jgi:hypothetical protein